MDLNRVTGSSLRQVCVDRLSGRKGGSAYSQRKADLLIFGTKMAPCLWRADPSFRNSVTGSGSGAKCSNILQDKKLYSMDTMMINSHKFNLNLLPVLATH
jgi:hypothetical protein